MRTKNPVIISLIVNPWRIFLIITNTTVQIERDMRKYYQISILKLVHKSSTSMTANPTSRFGRKEKIRGESSSSENVTKIAGSKEVVRANKLSWGVSLIPLNHETIIGTSWFVDHLYSVREREREKVSVTESETIVRAVLRLGQ